MSTIRFALLFVLVAALPGCSKSGQSQDAELGARKAQAAADNTIQNRGETESSAVTPLDQGESELDLKITQTIRQSIMDDQSLSTNAHNIKIVTKDGRVVLRGPVDSQDEKNRIQAVADRVAGANQVQNDLEIAPK